MRLNLLMMPLKNRNNFWLVILFAASPAIWNHMSIHSVLAANSENWNRQDKIVSRFAPVNFWSTTHLSSESASIYSQIPSNLVSPTLPKGGITETQQHDEPKQLKEHYRDVSQAVPEAVEQVLNPSPIDQSRKLERLRQRLKQEKQPTAESDDNRELGLRVRPKPLEQLPLPPTEQPRAEFKPIGFLRGRVGYFQTSNIFSATDRPIEDGLVFSGLTLASTYFPLGPKTYVNGSIDGNLIRYIEQSQYNYNQLKFNLNLYQQLSRQMYGEIGWSNQQLFYANSSDRFDGFKAGDRFLNENALRLSLGRRDPLTPRLMLDSLYELSVNFSEPQSRSRVNNSFWIALNYYLQKPLQVGVDYQVSLSNFTQRDREDQYHRIFGHLNYRLSHSSNVNLQGGVSLGGSTAPNIDFDGWFFSVNYNLELGRF
jgi:hypothetical protein